MKNVVKTEEIGDDVKAMLKFMKETDIEQDTHKWIRCLVWLMNNDLIFHEDTHSYSVKNKKINFQSVTTFIKWDEEPFNASEVSNKVSQDVNSIYYKMEPQEIMDIWVLNAIRAKRKHKQFEDWLEGTLNDIPHSKILKKLGITPKNCLGEVKLYSIKYKLAGTVDLLLFDVKKDEDGKIHIDFTISDIKTFTDITPQRIRSFSRQIFTYCLMMHKKIQEIQQLYPELLNDININVKPGVMIWLKPKQDLSKGVDIEDMDSYEKPATFEYDKDYLKEIKLKITERGK